jgi:hypothetical protein
MTGCRAAWLLVALLTAASACTSAEAPGVQREPGVRKELGGQREPDSQKEFELGPHRVQVSVPAGWEALDQGAQKRFRKGEADIALQNLGKVDWAPALASLHDEQRREVKSRRTITIDNHEAMDIETWNRLDHTWPQRVLLVRADDDLLALHTTRFADADTLKAFESIRDSLHFVAIVRR